MFERAPLLIDAGFGRCESCGYAFLVIGTEVTANGAVLNNPDADTFGGYNGSERLNDMHEFNFDTHRWTVISEPSNDKGVPSGRSSLIAEVRECAFRCLCACHARSSRVIRNA